MLALKCSEGGKEKIKYIKLLRCTPCHVKPPKGPEACSQAVMPGKAN